MRVFASRTRAVRATLTSPRPWLLLILLLTWGLRLYHLGSMSIWWDESLSYDRATQDLAGILSGAIRIQNVITQDLHPPLYFLLLHVTISLFGFTEFALRILSSFANVLTVALIYPVVVHLGALGGVRHAKWLGLPAALLAALSPFYVWYAQEARPYALVLFWSLLAFYALVKLLHEDWWIPIERIHRKVPAHTLIYLLALAATLATHYLSFLLLPFHAAVLLIYGWREPRWRWPAALLLTGFVVLLVLLTRGANQVTGGDVGSASMAPLFIILRDILNSFVGGMTVHLEDIAWLDLLLLALWLVGIASTVRPRQRDFRLALVLAAYILVPTGALQLGSYLRPLYLNSRHLITTSPAFYAGLALGVGALVARGARFGGRLRIPRRLALTAVAVTGLVLAAGGAVYSLNNLYFNPAFGKDDHKGWADYLRGRMRPGDLLILDAPQAETVYRYYAPQGLEWISLPNIGLSPAEEEKRDFSAVIKAYNTHPRIWFLELHRPVGDITNHTYNLLARWGTWRNITYFAGTSTQIVLHEITSDPLFPTTPPEIAHPLSVTFGDNIQLLGYDAPASLAAGEHTGVKLYWKLARPSGEDYGVSLRVVDDAGQRWAQWDEMPGGEMTPVSKWAAGSIAVDPHHLPLEPGTPPGRYHLEVSVYRPATLAALKPAGPGLAADATTVRLLDIQVTRPATPIDPRTLAVTHKSMSFGADLTLVGVDMDESPMNPGDMVPVTLYFQAHRNPGHAVTAQVQIAPPLWMFWNRTRSAASFTLPLTGVMAGDIVQISLQVPVADNAPPGTYSLLLGGGGTGLDQLLGFNDLGVVTVQ